MPEISVRSRRGAMQPVSRDNPLPVEAVGVFPTAFAQAPVLADYLWGLAKGGRVYIASDADQDDKVTGQTSFVDTTPTFMLNVPADVVAVPLFLNLSQGGTVAGAAIDVIIELDKVNRYSTGGTPEKAFSPSRLGVGPRSTLYSGATAVAGYGIRIWGATIGQDVSPAEGAVQGPFWKPELPYLLHGPAALLIYTYAGTTGPTWFWSIGWAEFDAKAI